MRINRRFVLTGLIAAPAVVAFENLMPVRALKGLDDLLVSHLVFDTKSGLVVRRSVSEIMAPEGKRYMVHFEPKPFIPPIIRERIWRSAKIIDGREVIEERVVRV